MRENILRAIKNFFGQTGETSDLDAVAFVCAAVDDLTQEDDLLVPFAHGNVQIADAFAVFGELRQLVIVRSEQGPRFDFVVEKFCYAPSNGEPVEGRCAPADLVEND